MAKKHLTLERWLVEERSSGSAVAYAALNHDLFSFDPHKFYVGVVVDPRHRGQGIGRTLAGLLDSEALDHRATAFWLNVRKDDARSLRFAERSGFEELRSSWMSELDLATVPEPAPPHDVPGIHFTTLAEEGVTSQEVRRRILDVTNESSRDVPRLGEFSPLSPEHFDALLDSSTNIPEAYLLARDGSEYVAVSNLQKDLAQPDSLFIGFTGTRRAYRGRGIASELKLRGIAYAKRAGFRYIRTFNDSLNEPIWKINEKLGFRRSVEWSNRERRFAPTPTGGSTPSGR
jgi:RimJ/RimL family protein N-acetyltransferase